MAAHQNSGSGRPGVVDLFSGVGGLSLGATRAGFRLLGAAELDPKAIAAHRRNFPRTTHLQVDLAEIDGEGLLRLLGVERDRIDGIIGGPPCQGFSCIGQRRRDDPRNELYVDFFRVLSQIRPRFFLVENVPGILSDGNSRTRAAALAELNGAYAIVGPMTLVAHEYGAPTTRARVFLVGYRPGELDDMSVDDFRPPKGVKRVRVRHALKGLPSKIDPEWQCDRDGWRKVRLPENTFFGRHLRGHIPPGVGDPEAIRLLREQSIVSGCLGTRHTEAVLRRYAAIEQGERDAVSKAHRLDPDGFCPTLRAGTGSDRGSYQAVRPLHPTENRVITPREAARLQGFPDWFQFDCTKWHSFRQIGNSVSPILAERILSVVLKALS